MSPSQQQKLAEQLRREQIHPVVVASHPRCGTHLLIDALRLNLPACNSWKWCGERNDRLYLNVDQFVARRSHLPFRTASAILRRAPRPLIKTHAFPAFDRILLEPDAPPVERVFVDALDDLAQILYVYRDGREALCSLYLMLHGPGANAASGIGPFLRERQGGLSLPRLWAQHVRSWNQRPGTYMVQMEQIVQNPQTVLEEIAELLSVPPPQHAPLLPRPRRPLRGRAERLLRTRPGSTAIMGKNPLGQKLDWRTAFTRDDRAFFRDEVGDLLVTLGYETSDSWVDSNTSPARPGARSRRSAAY